MTFNGNIDGVGTEIGQIIVNTNGSSQVVIFAGNVFTQNGVLLGNNSGTDTITANFSGAADTTVDGTVEGGASETVNVSVIGGNMVTRTDADVTAWNIGVNNTGRLQSNGQVRFTGDSVDLSNDSVSRFRAFDGWRFCAG